MTTKNKPRTHTPGPWKANGKTIRAVEIVRERVIARVGATDGLSWDTDNANAHLIAAAPELLEALRLGERAWKSYTDEFNPSGKARVVADWALINKAWCAIAAAIAKAEGR